MSKFCGLLCQRKQNENYEYLTYCQMETQVAHADDDNLAKFVPATKQSRTRLPIYYKSTPKKPNNRSVTVITANNSDIELCSSRSSNISKLPYLIQTPQVTKLTSTVLDANEAMHAQSPNTSNIPYKLIDTMQTEAHEKFYSCSESESSQTSESSDTANTTINGPDLKNLCDYRKCYVCHRDFNGQYEGDLTSKFSDRFQILQDNGTDYVFVRNLASKQCGYIPRECITTIDLFLSNLI
jgi:hypothetical protein